VEPIRSGIASDRFSKPSQRPPQVPGTDTPDRSPSPPPQLARALGTAYAIERELGRGGMATVYVARDLRHQRAVAIKVLHPELSALLGVERFLKEIELTASLQHPHILPLFDSGSAGDPRDSAGGRLLFYVMPLVAGESLRGRRARERQLPVGDAVRIATEVASALDYAHRRGVIHRDIKPENILLGEDGSALVGDFGIALAVSHAGGERLTQTGVAVGTPQYMAPEQAAGEQSVDARADVYALGTVLYEMLAGEPPFTGSSAQAIVARLLTDTPRPLSAHRPAVPPHIAAAVQVALEKLPADRFPTARAFADALARPGVSLPAGATAPTGAAPETDGARWRRAVARWLPWTVAALAVGSAAWLATHPRAVSSSDVAPLRFTLATPAFGDLYAGDAGVSVAISRDGRAVVYTALAPGGRQLYLRRLDDLRPTPLPYTDGALPPFFSPDGRWLAFGQGGRLMKLPLAGGDPTPVANVTGISSWAPDGIVVSGEIGGGLRIVSSTGAVKPLTRPDTVGGAHWHRMPVALPDDQTVLFADYPVKGNVTASRIGIASLSTGAATTLDLPGIAPLGMVDGKLIYVRHDRRIMAVPLDLATRRITGEAVPLVDQVLVGANGLVAAALAPAGTLVYLRDVQASSIVLAGIDGSRDSLVAGGRMYAFPRFSPDGRQLAVAAAEGAGQDIWVVDLASRTSSRLTSTGAAERPEWTPDGRRIAYVSGPVGGRADLWWQPADGSGAPERVATLPNSIREVSFSPDGRLAVLRADTPRLQHQIWLVPLDAERTPRPLVVGEFDAMSARVSPDGHWLAYVSNETGRNEVYVRPFPTGGARAAVSSGGGAEPVWAPDGRALYYRTGEHLVRVATGSSPEFTVGRRDTLFREMLREGYRASYFHAMHDIAPNGRRFVFVKSGGEGEELVVVTHFDTDVRRAFAGRR
jgi:serine/threonine-protein kinase